MAATDNDNCITEAICRTLSEAYECDVWPETEKQGFEAPCFFVRLIGAASRRIVKHRYVRENMYCVSYFPANESAEAECAGVQDRLFLALEYIAAGGSPLRGTKMRGEVIDGVLQFFVNYDLIVRKVTDEPLMEEIDVSDIGTKG